MKMGVLSFLFGIGLLLQIGILPRVNAVFGLGLDLGTLIQRADVQKCFYDALAANSDLTLTLGAALCTEQKLDDKSVRAIYQKLKKALEKTGCAVTDMAELPDLGTRVVGALDPIARTVVDILLQLTREHRDVLLANGAADAICKVVGPMLTPGCLPAFLGADLPSVINEIYKDCENDVKKTLPVEEVTKKVGKLIQCGVTEIGKKRQVASLACDLILTILNLIKADPKNNQAPKTDG